jgi:hypothetical protein
MAFWEHRNLSTTSGKLLESRWPDREAIFCGRTFTRDVDRGQSSRRHVCRLIASTVTGDLHRCISVLGVSQVPICRAEWEDEVRQGDVAWPVYESLERRTVGESRVSET